MIFEILLYILYGPIINIFLIWIFILDSLDCEQCAGILEELENIDDDCDRHGIKFVKTQDYSIAESYGVTDFPVLVYFENNVPNVYEDSLAEEEEVLQWLITQKTEDRIELITRVMLEKMVEETQYLAVYFCKYTLMYLVPS